MVRPLKIVDKVRNITNNTEGYIAYSTFGLSINGFSYSDGENGEQLYHFGTLGAPREVVESEWKRIYKWKYNMLRYEQEKQTKGDSDV